MADKRIELRGIFQKQVMGKDYIHLEKGQIAYSSTKLVSQAYKK